MQNRLSAIITGATQGIGRAIAEKLLSEGFDVAVCARTEADLQELRGAWKASFPEREVMAIQADLSDVDAVKRFAAEVIAAFGAPYILVNNAGIFKPGSLATEPEGQLEQMMAVNVYSAYHLTRALLPAMQEQGDGHIFNLCSVASLKAYPNGGAYSVTKYALLGFSDNLREELKETGIKVTAIAPGATWSRSWSGSGMSEDRIMKAEDIANLMWASYTLSKQACVEMLVVRPQLGDL